MKTLLFISALAVMGCMSCTHKKVDWVVKAQDGRFYQLEDGVANEAYRLREIDSSAIKMIIK